MMTHRSIVLPGLLAALLLAPSQARATGGGPKAARQAKRGKQRAKPTKAPPKRLQQAGIISLFGANSVRVELAHLHVSGPLPAAAARSMLRGLRSKLESCFPTAGKQATKGVVQLTVEVSPAGAARVSLTTEPKAPSKVDRCLHDVLAAARWPKHASASKVVARLAHVFEPPASALGGLIGSELPPGAFGGLGLRGAGRGGGGTGVGTIGIGRLGRIGHGSGTGSGSGSGWRRRKNVPRVMLGDAVVGEPQPSKEIIRRIVRRHINEVRYCYERYLVKHPNAGGTVRLRFVIDAQGKVISARAQSSTFEHDDVPLCLAHQVRRWLFPAPRGTVNVVYPFTFRPAAAQPASGAPPAPELN